MKKVAILGSGISGIGSAMLAKKNGYDVFISENRTISDKKFLLDNEIYFEELGHDLEKILQYDFVVKSPGINNKTKIISELKRNKMSIISEIEFAYQFTKAKIIAVTGTNGKTTTTLLISNMLEKAGFDVLTAGNIGISFAMELSLKDYQYVVLEISSFQLDDIKEFKPHISIILNITPDHLERYDYKMHKYIDSKMRICKNQHYNDVLIYNADDDNIFRNLDTQANKFPISIYKTLDKGAYFKENKINININNNNMTIHELALQGKHNVYNSMAASVAGKVLEVKDFIIRQSLMDFQNIEHRLEHVLNVHGIEFINDSKATNINSVWYALESMHKKTVWIAGGVDKGNSYDELLDLVKEKVHSIVLLGEASNKISKFFKNTVDNISFARSMHEAVLISYDLANKGEAVLLSPACSSFDMFKNFEERGFEFKKSVRSL